MLVLTYSSTSVLKLDKRGQLASFYKNIIVFHVTVQPRLSKPQLSGPSIT